MTWLHALPSNNTVNKNNTSKDRPAGNENLPPDMRCRWLGQWTRKMVNMWTRSFWWVYINTKTPKVQVGKRIYFSERAGLITETFCWILSILYLGSGCFGHQYDSQAFLFSLVNKPGWAPVKFNQRYGSLSQSIYRCHPGPTFGGGHDLQIYFLYKSSYSKVGHTYSPPSGYDLGSNPAETFMAGSFHFNPDEIETFYYAAFTSQGRFED